MDIGGSELVRPRVTGKTCVGCVRIDGTGSIARLVLALPPLLAGAGIDTLSDEAVYGPPLSR